MAKKGMKRPDVTHIKLRNEQAAVPELQGKAKSTKEKANPIIANTHAPSQKVFHHTMKNEKPISPAHGVVDTDLGRDNAENDLSNADLQDL